LIVDANGIPLATILTGANRHDVTQLQPLVEAIPPVHGKVGRPRQRPEVLLGDRGYDSEPQRQWLRAHGIEPWLAKRNVPHGSGLGIYRWVVNARWRGCISSGACACAMNGVTICTRRSWLLDAS
jgi:hypothetical protein